VAGTLLIVSRLSAIALRPLMGDGADSVVQAVVGRLTDNSQQVTRALQIAQKRAWVSLETSLAGSSWWQRCKATLTAAEEKAFKAQVQSFLDALPPASGPVADPKFKSECLTELRAAKKAGVLPGEPKPTDLTDAATFFTRYTDPVAMLEQEWRAVLDVCNGLRGAGFGRLAEFVALRPGADPPLLQIAVRYFFQRQIETDEELARGLTYRQLETLSGAQELGFRTLSDALSRHGDRLEQLLGDVHETVTETRREVGEVKNLVEGARDDLEIIRAALDDQGRQMRDLVQALAQLMARTNSAPAPAAAAVETDRAAAEDVLRRAQALPQQQQSEGVGRLVHQLEKLTQSYDANRQRAFPFLAPSSAEAAPPSPQPAERPTLRQVRGRLINESLFRAETPAPPPSPAPEPPPAEAKPKSKPIISDIFRPKKPADGKESGQ
jgi:hypothetical protein